MRRALWCLLMFAACDKGTAGDVALPDQPTYDLGAQAHTAEQQSLLLADSLFSFDPTLDTAATADANAQTIQANATAKLAGCGSVTLSGTTVTVAFGPPPGCTLTNGVKASGTVTASVSKTASTLTVALTFTSLVVNGTAIAGTASFATSNGTTYTMIANLTSGDTSDQVNLTVVGAAGGFTISGSTQQGTSKIDYASVHYSTGKCYPDGGSLTISKSLIKMTVTFSATTADSGKVTVMEGRKSYPMTLPAYGSCPSTGVRDAGTADR